MDTGMNTWKRKLLACLRDPPEQADHDTSAADRMPFPKTEAACEKEASFRHPLSGAPLYDPDDFPDEAVKTVTDILPDFETLDPHTRFWLAWRLWPEYAATHKNTPNSGTLPYLPADTRIPDHSIWHHMSVTSALEATRGPDGDLKPALLLFQLGPVQEFIAQARSTRNLWSGSYMLSWLIAHAIQSVAEKFGPNSVVFPSLRGQPLFDWLNQSKLKHDACADSRSYWEHLNSSAFQESVLTPNFPNRFLAIVPADYNPEEAVQALENEWVKICNACKTWLEQKRCPVKHVARWDAQVKRAWQANWQVWPWQDIGRTVELFKRTPMNKSFNMDSFVAVLEAGQYPAHSGNFWHVHYQLCQHRLDARRQTRDFKAWSGVPGAVKDDYSGREEEVIDEEWREEADKRIGHLFRKKNEHLGAVNLVKRVWHQAYLAEKQGLKRARESFDSVPAIAAEPWRRKAILTLAENDRAWTDLLKFQRAVGAQKENLDFAVPETNREREWLNSVDASVFFSSIWENLKLPDVGKALTAFITSSKRGRPSSYYAVLALDGDEMGKWISGEKTPEIGKVVCGSAKTCFEKTEDGKKWLATRRPISPSFHLQFSEALSNFALYAARRIVEHHHGQLIYAGGDDVLAMLPAEEALSCAQGLRSAFRGEGLAARYPDLFADAKPGMVQLKDGDKGARRPHEPSWPLLVPGTEATVSIGIAMGHIREPLQDMVQTAQEAEKRAKKKYGRDAVSVTLYKRSGESIEWGAKFTSEPFDLLDFLNNGDTYKPPIDQPDKPMPISGKFPYRVCELLRKYEPGVGDWKPLAKAEIAWAIGQLKKHEVLAELKTKTESWLAVAPSLTDFYNLFALEAFIARQGED